MNTTPHASKKLLVNLLDGPRNLDDISGKNRASAYNLLRTMEKRGLAMRTGQHHTHNRKWMLTPSGTRIASQWSYKLKTLNDHPSQEPIVTKVEEPKKKRVHGGALVVLSALARFGIPATNGDLAEETGYHPSSISRTLQVLQENELVHRLKNLSWEITEEGLAKSGVIWPKNDGVGKIEVIPKPIDWQLRHIEYLEEITKLLISVKGNES